VIDAVYLEVEARGAAIDDVRGAAARHGVEVVELGVGVLARMADAVAPQPVAAVAALPLSGTTAIGSGVVLVLCDLADPGNLGTAIRAADAAGCAGVVVCGQSVDVANPKALRASAGSVFHLPVVELATLEGAAHALRGTGRRVLGTAAVGGQDLWTASIDDDCAVVVGGEARGLGADALQLLDAVVTIPMAGAAESLNAGVAAALVCFEALRRRRGGAAAADASPTI
jgi:TrmH family RNA methyltransferase